MKVGRCLIFSVNRTIWATGYGRWGKLPSKFSLCNYTDGNTIGHGSRHEIKKREGVRSEIEIILFCTMILEDDYHYWSKAYETSKRKGAHNI